MIITIEYQGAIKTIHTENMNKEALQQHIMHCLYVLAEIEREVDVINRLIRTCSNQYLAGELFSGRLKECQLRKERFSESLCWLYYATGFENPIDSSCEYEIPEMFNHIVNIQFFLKAARKHVPEKTIKNIIEDAFKIGREKLKAKNEGL